MVPILIESNLTTFVLKSRKKGNNIGPQKVVDMVLSLTQKMTMICIIIKSYFCLMKIQNAKDFTRTPNIVLIFVFYLKHAQH